VAHAEQIGIDEIIDRGVAAAAGLPASIVYAGLSLGVMPLPLYPGSAHLFTDATLADYDESAARLVLERSKELLGRWS
jgi:hypothetical protein